VRLAVARWAGLPASAVEVRETHISWVFLAADRAFKLKKPVVFDFLDYGTPARRRHMCHEEVRLNRTLAPGIYIGVRAVIASVEGLRIGDDDPAAIDSIVEMARYDERASLAVAVTRHSVAPRQLEAIGRALASYHAQRPRRVAPDGAAFVRAEVRENIRELRARLSDTDRTRLDQLARFMDRFMDAKHALVDSRMQSGELREGHGDLRAEHIILEPELRIVDCVEFNRLLRTIDVADDLAFLVMDLLSLDAEPSARRVIDAYRAAGGDCGPPVLVWFYAAHRAMVRAKVAVLRAAQSPPHRHQAPASRSAAHHLEVAERCTWRARGPLVLVICGPPAAGKSQLATHLGARTATPVLNSDVVRKQLAGLPPTVRGPAEIYERAFSLATYAELGRRVAAGLREDAGVLVDATFGHRRQRDAFMATCPSHARVHYVQCHAPAAVLIDRATAREHDPMAVSDATAEIVDREQAAFEALDEVAAGHRLTLDTDRPTSAAVDELLAWLDGRLAPMAAAGQDPSG
jgi:hypothetical protein